MAVYSITTEAEEALGAGTLETLLQLRGATTSKAKIIAWGVSFDGVTATDAPVLVQFCRQTSDGTTSTAATEVKFDADEPAAGCTGFHSFGATEPTIGDVLELYEIHPQGGLFVREYPPGREPVLDDAATSRIAIVATAGAAVNAVAWMQWEE